MSTTEKNVFISHHGKDDEHISKLKNLLNSNGYILKNSSIDSTKPNQATNEEYIKAMLRERIRWASVTLVLIGHDTHDRKWVNWEIEEAHKQGKRVVGVFIFGATDADVPEAFEKYGNTLEGWNSEKIIDAINGKSNDFKKPDGTPWENKWKSNRGEC